MNNTTKYFSQKLKQSTNVPYSFQLKASLFLSVFIPLVLSACHKEPAPKVSIPRVLVSTVGATNSSEVRSFTGTIMPRYQTNISFRASGKVVERLVEVGQVVKQGQVLARLDDADYTLAAKAAEAQLKAAQVEATQAASDEARFRRLMVDGSVGTADHERQKARADATAAVQAQAAQGLALANNKLTYLNLTAPSSGVITAINFEVGQTVGEGMPIAVLSRQGEMEVVFDVPEEIVDNLSAWQAKANLSGQSAQRFNLTLRVVSPAASVLSKTFQAKYRITSGEPSVIASLKQGMNVELRLSHAVTSNSTALPANAILETSKKPFVWVVTPANTLKQQPVHIDKFSNETVWVSGLLDGMRVVTAGVQKLDNTMTVEPIERIQRGALTDAAYGESVDVSKPIPSALSVTPSIDSAATGVAK